MGLVYFPSSSVFGSRSAYTCRREQGVTSDRGEAQLATSKAQLPLFHLKTHRAISTTRALMALGIPELGPPAAVPSFQVLEMSLAAPAAWAFGQKRLIASAAPSRESLDFKQPTILRSCLFGL